MSVTANILVFASEAKLWSFETQYVVACIELWEHVQ